MSHASLSTQPNASRRTLIKGLFSAPMLPFASSVTGAALLSACGGMETQNAIAGAKFVGMNALQAGEWEAMATTTVRSKIELSYINGTKQMFDLAYEPFFITGASVPKHGGGSIIAGSYYDINGNPIMDKTGATPRQFFSDAPDGTSLISVPGAKVAGVKGNTVFAVVQFEYTSWAQDGKTDMYGKLPSPIAVLTLDQNPQTGKLTLVKYHNVDTSKVNGLWITCGASLSPWGTHLSSEEYEPDAFAARSANFMDAFSQNLYGDPAKANPYHYGHMPEVTVNADGTGSIKKHYCMGRISHELVQVMPDERTATMGDDATNGGFFMFVADKARDLSSGTLYVAKVGSGFSIEPGAAPAPLTWIKLGSATSAEIEKLASSTKPTDIFDLRTADPADATFTKIITNGKTEWVKLKPGMDKAAAFLETHRYAALKGGSMGFSKMEGTTVNVRDKIGYSALQNIQDSMVVGGKGHTPGNGISVPKQLKAGAVMSYPLVGGVKDTAGGAIDSNWVPKEMSALITGQDIAAADDPYKLGNTAHPDKIANPDNVKFSESMRTLFIGEDSGQHVNNFLWAYHVDTKQLTRLMSVPAGGESTGLHAVDELNGWTYIMSNFQHAGDWSALHSVVRPNVDALINKNYNNKFGAAVGYLTSSPTQMKASI